MSDLFVSARKLLIRGKSGRLHIVTAGEGSHSMFVAAVGCRAEGKKFVGRGASMIAAVSDAIVKYNAGDAVPDQADEMVAKIVAQKEDDKPRIISPY